MRFMILVKASRSSEAGGKPTEKLLSEQVTYHEELAEADILQDAAGLKSSSHGWRIRYVGDERTVVEGPFMDSNDLVAGYTIINDVSARCLQAQGLLTISKGYETFCPMGPWMVTKDEIPDPHNLHLRCWVNGELRQDGWSSEMIVDIPGLISDFSKVLELSPGDIIYTGTTTGCGAFQNPPTFLFAGDVVRMEITGLGVMETPIADAAGAGQ